jgi:hypothetical protein
MAIALDCTAPIQTGQGSDMHEPIVITSEEHPVADSDEGSDNDRQSILVSRSQPTGQGE